MYAGRVVETGPADRVLRHARHPYTRALVASVPTMADEPGSALPTVRQVVTTLMGPIDDDALADPTLTVAADAPEWTPSGNPVAPTVSGEPLLTVRDLTVTFPGGFGKPARHAVRGVGFEIAAGESFGLVGESGSGKSTIARVITGLQRPGTGSVLLQDKDITALGRRALSRRVQLVFQDPYGSLNPDRTIGDSVGALLTVSASGVPRPGRAQLREKVAGLLAEVGLDPGLATAYPDQLSGGMRQRAGIARALSVGPELLVADEPVSALDVSVQAQVLNLLTELRRTRGLALLFISHDLTVVRHLCTRVAVLNAGEIVEIGERDQVLADPRSDYTRALLDATLHLDRVSP